MDAPAGPLVIETDPRRFDRIVGNLLDNAREHAPGAPVRVSASVGGDGTIVIEVEDRGPGTATGDLEALFERFAKADPARSGGSGLGLAIAREHAELLGGRLTAERVQGGGLRVVLVLPVTEALPDGDPSVTPAGEAERRSEAARSPDS